MYSLNKTDQWKANSV